MTQGKPRGVETDKSLLIIAMWRQGADTAEISERTRIPEHEVYRVTSARPPTVRRNLNIPYAGARQ